MFNWLLVSLKLRLLSSRYYCSGQFFTEEKYFSFQCCWSEKLVSLSDRMRKMEISSVCGLRAQCLQVRSKNLCEKLQTKRRVGRWAYNLIGNGNLRYLFVKSSHCDRESKLSKLKIEACHNESWKSAWNSLHAANRDWLTWMTSHMSTAIISRHEVDHDWDPTSKWDLQFEIKRKKSPWSYVMNARCSTWTYVSCHDDFV